VSKIHSATQIQNKTPSHGNFGVLLISALMILK